MYATALEPHWQMVMIRVRTMVTIKLSLHPIVALSDDYWSR